MARKVTKKAKTEKKPPAKKTAKKKTEKTAAEMAGPRGAGIWDNLTKPFSLPMCHRMIAAAVMRNEQVSARANFQEERKHLKELLKETQTGKEFDKLAGKLLHIEDSIRRTKTTEKAAVESLLKLALESVGGDLFQIAEDEDTEKPEKDIEGQLMIGDAKARIDIKLRHLDLCEVVRDDGSIEARGKFDQFYSKETAASVFVGADTKKFKLDKDKLSVRKIEPPTLGERYIFTGLDKSEKRKETVGAVVHITPMGHIGIKPDEGNGGIFELQNGLLNYVWEVAKHPG